MLLPATMMMTMSSLAVAQTTDSTSVDGSPLAQSANTPRKASKVTVRVTPHVLSGERVKAHGKVRPGGRRWVTVRVSGKKVKTVRTERDGTYRVRFTADQGIGVYKLTAKVRGNDRAKPAESRDQRLNVYRRTFASWYGPGLYGNSTACGQTLTPDTMGVANKTLPCGTKVTLHYRGRTVTVPVIDRGPYVAGRDWDLTGATKSKLGFGSTGTVLSTK